MTEKVTGTRHAPGATVTEGTVYAPLIGTLWRTLETYGIDPRKTIPADLYRPGLEGGVARRVPMKVFFDLLNRLAEKVDDPAAGLRVAQVLQPTHLGALGHAWIASTTLKEALERAARFNRMLNEAVSLEVSVSPGKIKASYHIEPVGLHADIRIDALLASLMQLCRLNFGEELKPLEVRMRRPRPEDTQPWTDAFGIPVQFGQEEDSLTLDLGDAERDLTVSNPQLVAVHEEILERQLAKLSRQDVIGRARAAIVEALPSGEVNEQVVAARMGMTARTLYNHLSERRLPFRTLLAQTRRQLAERYLLDPAYSMTEISFLLGYSDSSAFSRAFRSWTGVPPSEYLKSLRRSP